MEFVTFIMQPNPPTFRDEVLPLEFYRLGAQIVHTKMGENMLEDLFEAFNLWTYERLIEMYDIDDDCLTVTEEMRSMSVGDLVIHINLDTKAEMSYLCASNGWTKLNTPTGIDATCTCEIDGMCMIHSVPEHNSYKKEGK